MKLYFEIMEVDKENERVQVKGIFEGNEEEETRTFTFDDFEMDYDEIKVGEKLIVETIEDSELFLIYQPRRR